MQRGTYTLALSSESGCSVSSQLEVTVIGTFTTYYADADGDGFGDASAMLEATEQPEGYVLDNTDCDDTNETVYPGAIEICDGLDNDCNGLTDDENINPIPICNDITIVLDETGNYTLTQADIDAIGAGSSDNCSAITLSVDTTTFDCSNVGQANPITMTVTDGNNNSATCTATVFVTETQPPVLVCEPAIFISNTPGLCSGTTILTEPTVTDNCTTNANSLKFDGINDRVTLPEFNIGTSDFTIETWIKPNANVAGYLVSNRTNEPNQQGNWFVLSRQASGNIAFEMAASGSPSYLPMVSNSSTPPNTWTHIAVSRQGTMVTLYINGVADSSVNDSFVRNLSTGNFSLLGGFPAFNAAWFNGKMKEVRIWEVARTATEINTYINSAITPQAGLKAVYHFNQGTNGLDNTGITSLIDDSGNNLNGTLVNFTLNGTSSNFVNDMFMYNDAPAIFPLGDTLVTWTATDDSGNSATCTQLVTVNDTEAPIAQCQPVTVTLDSNGVGTISATDLNDGSTDNCGIQSIQIGNVLSQYLKDGNFNNIGHGQSFTASTTGYLKSVKILVQGNQTGKTIHFYNSGTGSGISGSVGTPVYSETNVAFVDSANGTIWTEIVLSTPFPVIAGNQYSFVIEEFSHVYYTGFGNSYSGGSFIFNYDLSSGCCSWGDMAFELSFLEDEATFDCSHLGTNTVALTVTDESGNMSSCFTTVTVISTSVYYADADNDGYGNPAVSYVGCAQAGYVLDNTDCDDTNNTVYPGATEICYDGLDNDCDGIIDNGCTPIVSVVQPAQCGITLSTLDSYVYANLVAGAQGYRFRVTNLSTNEVQTIDRALRVFRFTQLTSYAFATEYSVEVSVRINNVWQPFYGTPCTVSTPDTTTQIQASQCNTAISNLNNSIFADIVPFATGYRFRVTNTLNPIDVQTIDRPIRDFRMTNLATVEFNTTYNVEVAVRNTDGTYLSYGPVCNITTPMFPTVGLEDAQCDEYLVSSNTETLFAESYPGVEQYRFLLENINLPYNQTVDRATRTVTLNNFTGLVPGEMYTVRVAIRLNGVWGPYGKSCSIITPGGEIILIRTEESTNETGFRAIAYPNPFATSFTLDVRTSNTEVVSLTVYDMAGRLLEVREVKAQDVTNYQFGDRYSSGVYNVIVTQGEETRTVRVVKQ
ncbi:T9SS type A sorting domain-containing protein [Flavobacterium piscinae]|uniref:LamG-like jellyroll fold domain-containing protein n=1 Tax=Flavobacterium piscinae TaxID=2506424 RepID=UPI0019AAA3EA|nr:LamG-like jellyroll fold domain-containing protein [Flavobacterium piscinae]MBC8884300.1 T9SS type A sorting domain-containing protein [Flavobacterium piscinae]